MCDELDNALCEPNKPWTACMKDEKCKDATPYQILYDPNYKGCLEGTECAACCPYGSRNLPIEEHVWEENWRDCKWDREDGKCIRKVGGHFSTKEDCDTHSGACYDALKEKCGNLSTTVPTPMEQPQQKAHTNNYKNAYTVITTLIDMNPPKRTFKLSTRVQIPECKYNTDVVNRFIKTACGKEFVGKCIRHLGEIYPAHDLGPAVWIDNLDHCVVTKQSKSDGAKDTLIKRICRREKLQVS